MRIFVRTVNATLTSVAALLLLFLLLFPPKSMHELENTACGLIILTLFLGPVLFLLILSYYVIFRPSPPERANPRPLSSNLILRHAIIGTCLAGTGAVFIQGIIPSVWFIFLLVGCIIGAVVGFFRQRAQQY
jgi:amino acid transporter